ncbi:DHCW motif cupin fold protein [Adhaeribacter swui]|uniref:DHCW motif cupin fold protein n=1 Tax=Adhaeribacter swui TaxID=2086471 RepID=A0A7G7G3L7_9BACT|nr:DHCW motif cupin fold protein [Adhaeribacter swui]QNF31751.1 DHCW motif cupin fold protein [Adhaeribacter swui]
MKIENIPFQLINWDEVEVVEVPGLTGSAMSKIWELGNVRVRLVQYLPEYQANHWNHRGQVMLVLAGEVLVTLTDGRTSMVQAGETFVVADNTEAHKIASGNGATVFIVD